MNRHVALANLAVAFVFLFGAAFSCGPSNSNRTSTPRTSREDTDGGFSRSVVERQVRARYASPGDENHEAWTVDIQSIDLGDSHPWERGEIVGGTPGQTVYTARVRFIQRKHYTDSTQVWAMNWVFDCINNADGWNCEPGPELPRTTDRQPDERATDRE